MSGESQLDRIERLLAGQSLAIESQAVAITSQTRSLERLDLAWQRRHVAMHESIDTLAIATQKGFDDVYKRFDDVYRRLDGVDRRFDGIDRRLGRIETRVENLEAETRLFREQTERRLTTIESRAD